MFHAKACRLPQKSFGNTEKLHASSSSGIFTFLNHLKTVLMCKFTFFKFKPIQNCLSLRIFCFIFK